MQRIHDSHARSIAAEVDREGRLLTWSCLKRKPEKDRPLLACRYDRTGDLIEFSDPYRHSFSFRYDDNKRMVAQTDRPGLHLPLRIRQGRALRLGRPEKTGSTRSGLSTDQKSKSPW